jgi:hypothetical protein
MRLDQGLWNRGYQAMLEKSAARSLLLPVLLASGLALAQSPDAAFQAKNWRAAIKGYRELTQQSPTDARAWLRLALSLHGAGQHAEAIETAKEAGKRGAPPIMVAMAQVRAHGRTKNRDQAFTLLDEALAAGFRQPTLLKTDADFAELRKDARFKAALERADRAARPCVYSAQAREFDFWLGEWEVTANGGPAGTSSVQSILDSCVLFENWTGGGGSTGKSFNLYDAVTRSWRQTWVDNTGGIIDFRGGLREGAMVLTGETLGADGKKTAQRMTFTPTSPNEIRQLWEQSSDGSTWTVAFDGVYKRHKKR